MQPALWREDRVLAVVRVAEHGGAVRLPKGVRAKVDAVRRGEMTTIVKRAALAGARAGVLCTIEVLRRGKLDLK